MPDLKSFQARVSDITQLIADQTQNTSLGHVSRSLVYAAARVSAENGVKQSANTEESRSNREAVIDYYTTQYRLELERCLDEIIEQTDRQEG